jgi:hypothetical protein
MVNMAYGTLAVLYIDVRRVNGEKKHESVAVCRGVKCLKKQHSMAYGTLAVLYIDVRRVNGDKTKKMGQKMARNLLNAQHAAPENANSGCRRRSVLKDVHVLTYFLY